MDDLDQGFKINPTQDIVGDQSMTPGNNADYYPNSALSNLENNMGEAAHGVGALAGYAVKYAGDAAGIMFPSINLLSTNKTVNEFHNALDLKAHQVGQSIIDDQNQDIAQDRFDARYQSPVMSFVGHTAPYLLLSAADPLLGLAGRSAGLSTEAAIASEGVESAEEVGTGVGGLMQRMANSRAAQWAGGQFEDFASFNGSMIPQYYADGVQVDNNGKAYWDFNDSLKSAAWSQLPFVGIKSLGWLAAKTFTKSGSAVAHEIESAMDEDDVNDLNLDQPLIKENEESLTNEQKEILDREVKDQFNPQAKPSESLQIPDESLKDWESASTGVFEDPVIQKQAKRAVISRGLLLSGKIADIRNATHALALSKFIKGYQKWFDQKGLRQVYYNSKIQELLGQVSDKSKLEKYNKLDKALFDAKPYRSKNAIKADAEEKTIRGYVKSEETGYRTFPSKEWYRFAKSEETPEFMRAYNEIESMARSGDNVSLHMLKLLKENNASKQARRNVAFHNEVKDAIRNPMSDDEIRAFEESKSQGFADRADSQLTNNMDDLQSKYEKADFSDYLNPDSEKYIKLLQKMDSTNYKKFEAYYACMLRA